MVEYRAGEAWISKDQGVKEKERCFGSRRRLWSRWLGWRVVCFWKRRVKIAREFRSQAWWRHWCSEGIIGVVEEKKEVFLLFTRIWSFIRKWPRYSIFRLFSTVHVYASNQRNIGHRRNFKALKIRCYPWNSSKKRNIRSITVHKGSQYTLIKLGWCRWWLHAFANFSCLAD